MSKLDDILVNLDFQIIALRGDETSDNVISTAKAQVKDLMLELYEESKSKFGTSLPQQDQLFKNKIDEL